MSTDTPIADQASKATQGRGLSGPATGGGELAVPTSAELATLLGAHIIPVRQWIAALVDAEQFEESDEEDASLSIVRAILLAETSEQVFGAMNVQSVKELLGDQPGAASNVFEIRGAIPLKSTFAEGPSAFSVIYARDLAETTDVTLSCGGRAVQAAIVAHLIHGWLPMKARFVRRRKPTRSGFYPINLEAGI